MFRAFNPLSNAAKKLSKNPINLHLQNSAVSSHIKTGGKGGNQFARVRTEYKYPLRSKVADFLHKAFLTVVLGSSLLFLSFMLATIPLNTEKSVELQAKEEKAQKMRELERLEAEKDSKA
ncbi:hypothetical protein FOG51_02517 [Hanseniaspora uvarum]|jgi:hypothetical protein|uniref:Uncharacterized protein n=1 Tax=Hanseniaspora uvarum TaxID=29833 RepID=A0A1E5R9T0_HANUV|nr:hypothetical protein FOG48_02989 [Hanseniaspora uvarum]KAF0272363.1 hypothetical protein FOG51_02517 [Hanseniaspora uvarum]KAF0275655.1 hypothetical protein FOG50_03497 [Hanseniaspora uvarum]OEJ83654.1 hypothetical protein AWRI3580_g3616 [Hanseniaspora uvarum]